MRTLGLSGPPSGDCISPGSALALRLALQVCVAALRWRRIALGCHIALTRALALRLSLIAAFFSQTLPAVIGADGARIWYLGRSTGDWKGASYSVVIDRCVGGLALGLLVMSVLPGAYVRISDPVGRLSLAVVGFTCLLAFAAVIAVGALPGMDRWPATRHARAVAVISGRLIRHPADGAAIAAYSIAIHLLSVFAVLCLAEALSVPLSAADALMLVPPVMLITMVPISIAGWGVRETAFVAALAYANIDSSRGLLISLLFGAATFILGLTGGAVWVTEFWLE